MKFTKTIKKYFNKLLIAVFVNNAFLPKLTGCHQISSRSFFVDKRQFHICSRCTGIVVGLAISPLILIFTNKYEIFLISLSILTIDGVTQLLGFRSSNNSLRFFTGFFTGAFILVFLRFIIGNLFF